ncbi:TenA family protein [Streptomyces sp. 4N509B]|uniref:TenA family protein n=1 Tax=Streptomyces sp. 4N509B TaxID=3457413 RepID=UPI003FD62C91
MSATDSDTRLTTSFVDQCRQATAAGWEAYERHPWLTDLEQGRMTVERFLAFQVDDAPFIPYIHRTLALGLAKAPTGSAWSMTAANLLSDYFVATETDFKRKLVESLGWDAVRFDEGALTPAREAYANHLLTTGLAGGIGEIAAALYPCAMFTSVVGERFRGVHISGPEAFGAWARYYANKAGSEMAEAHAALMNACATTAEERQRMLFAYARSLQHQIRVFDAAYEGHPGWPRTGWATVDPARVTPAGPEPEPEPAPASVEGNMP